MRNLHPAVRRRGTIAALLPALFCFPTLAPAIDTVEEVDKIFHDFYRKPLNLEAVYAAEGFELRKDAMTFQFQKGDFFLMEPVNGEVTGAYFAGKGKARMTPPIAMERKQLAKFTKSETLDMEFTEMVLRFTDGTSKKIQALPKRSSPDSAATTKAAGRFAEQMSLIGGFQVLAMEMDYLEARISGLQDRDFFFALLQTSLYPRVVFSYNGQAIRQLIFDQPNREVFLGHWDRIGSQIRVYTWCDFHKAADYDDQGGYMADLEKDLKDLLDISHYDMKVNIRNLKTVDVSARVKLASLTGGLRGIRLDLINTLDFTNWESRQLQARVTAVTDGDGNPLPYIHKRHQLLVLTPAPLAAGQEFVLNVEVQEDTIQQATKESFSLLSTYPWYPWYGYLGGRFTFEWEVRVPKPYQATGSGRMLREWEEGDVNCSVWTSDKPVSAASLLFGRFQRETGTFKSSANGQSVRINVHAFPLMTGAITDPETLRRYGYSSPTTVEIRVPGTKMTDILEESKQVLTLFEDIYGPFPYDELDIAQMAPYAGFGESPPGLVQLTGEAFASQSEDASDYLHGFLSHEIAHQWWANEIGWYEDEDEWLSESFAEYASGIFVQQYQGEKRFQQVLRDWRNQAKVADATAPIAAANRLAGDTAARDRYYLIYSKGPAVLHMLRTMMGDENYKKAMTAVTAKYGHKNITTTHVQREVEKVVGYSLDWFFDQWFRGTGLPEIRFRYEVKPAEDGKFLFTGHFRQDPAAFKRFLGLPITFQFGKDQMAVQKVMIKGPEETVQLKLPLEPKKVIVDEGNALLADIIYEK